MLIKMCRKKIKLHLSKLGRPRDPHLTPLTLRRFDLRERKAVGVAHRLLVQGLPEDGASMNLVFV